MPRRLLKLIPCTVVALLVWLIFPKISLERSFVYLTAHLISSPPFFITDSDSTHGGYILRNLRETAPDLTEKLATNITIDDDPQQVFQTSPPSPVDFAIILKNISRLGHKSVAIGMTLYWPEPDIISLTALDRQLALFSPAITTVPLSRRPLSSALPPAFRRASIPLSEIRGDTSGLPMVNHIAIPDVILGKESTLAGFSSLESETDTAFPTMVARWEDRIVFSFHLLAAISHYQSSVSETQVIMGKYVSIGNGKAYVPIDEFGRLSIRIPRITESETPTVAAQNLIDAPEDFFDTPLSEPLLIRNDISSADSASLLFSEKLLPTVSLLSDPEGPTRSRRFDRLSWPIEFIFLASILSLIYGLGNYPKIKWQFCLGGTVIVFLIIHFTVIGFAQIWPPTLPALTMVLVAFPLERKRKTQSSKPSSDVNLPNSKSKPRTPESVSETTEQVSAKQPIKRARKKPKSKRPRKRKGR
ncbi:MAG: hypothetical protein AB8D78_08060 [Akkermansiaceae bacterium]